MSKMPRKYIFAAVGLKMQKDPPQIKDFVIFDLKTIKKMEKNAYFQTYFPYMNSEINRNRDL